MSSTAEKQGNPCFSAASPDATTISTAVARYIESTHFGTAMQERGVYKAKWQELLSKHTSAHSATERLQKDLQQLQTSYADLQEVNHALEHRLLGHHSPTAEHHAATAGHQFGSTQALSNPARQLYYSPPRAAANLGAAANRAGQGEQEVGRRAEGISRLGSISDLDQLLAEHKGRSSPAHGHAFEHSEVTLSSEGVSSAGAQTQLAGCVSSEDIMARLTRSPGGATGGLLHLPRFATGHDHNAFTAFQNMPSSDWTVPMIANMRHQCGRPDVGPVHVVKS